MDGDDNTIYQITFNAINAKLLIPEGHKRKRNTHSSNQANPSYIKPVQIHSFINLLINHHHYY
jgi:hypothetical protein